METKLKHCGEIDLFRFVFAFIIVLRHTDALFGERLFFEGGAFGVEFFFLVSGYLMMASIDKMNNRPIVSLGDETLAYLKRKIASFYPELLLAFGMAFAVQSAAKKLDLIGMIKLACNSFFEIFLLSHSGIGGAHIIGPVWYLSTMILVMAILYPLIRKYQDTMTKIILPLLAIFILAFIVKNYNHFRTPGKWIFWGYKGFFRGAGELCLGTVLYWAAQWLKTFRFKPLMKVLLSLIKWVCWLVVIIYMTKETLKYDAFCLALMAIAITIAFSQKAIESDLYPNKVFLLLGRFSLPLYLCHSCYANYLNH